MSMGSMSKKTELEKTSVVQNKASSQTMIPKKILGTLWPPQKNLTKVRWIKQGDKIIIEPITKEE